MKTSASPSPLKRALLSLATSTLLADPRTAAAQVGATKCASSKECAGDLVCIDYRCVAPHAKGAPPPPLATPPPALAAPAPAPALADAPKAPAPDRPASSLDDVVRTPAHVDLRGTVGFAPAVGAFCVVGTQCFADVRAALTFGIGDVHANVLASSGIGGVGLGISLGSPFFQVGPATSRFALAVRAGADVQLLGAPGSSPPCFSSSPPCYPSAGANSSGFRLGAKILPLELSLSVAVIHELAVELRAGVGVVLIGDFNDTILTAPAVELTPGIRF